MYMLSIINWKKMPKLLCLYSISVMSKIWQRSTAWILIHTVYSHQTGVPPAPHSPPSVCVESPSPGCHVPLSGSERRAWANRHSTFSFKMSHVHWKITISINLLYFLTSKSIFFSFLHTKVLGNTKFKIKNDYMCTRKKITKKTILSI